jgi:predicted Zn-dependent protease
MITSAIALLTLSSFSQATLCQLHPEDPRITAIEWEAWAEWQSQQTKEEIRHQEDLKGDAELGKKYAERADKELKASKDQAAIDRVNRVAGELASIANANAITVLWGDKRLNPYAYQIKVVEKDEVNAFSLPGGYIYVYDGLLKFCDSDDELAGVLAHEIAHASCRHLATLQKEQSKVDIFTLPLILISLLAGGEAGSGGIMLGTLANQALASGWGQNAERAADYAGFQYILKSKYNPVGMLTFMEKLGRNQRTLEAIDWGIYRTHPPSKERATAIESYIMGAQLPVKRSQVSTDYRAAVAVDVKGAISLKFATRTLFPLGGDQAKARADALIPVLNDFFDNVPDLFEVSVSGKSTITYRRQPLLTLTEADASAANVSLDELTGSAARAIKRELYLLAFRVWDSK